MANTSESIGDHEIKESDFLQIRSFLHHNDVGRKLWEAGACLSEYLIHYPEVIRAKNVLELGAGVGLTGLIASVCGGFGGSARNVHMTDYTEGALENLRFNMEANAQWLKKRGADLRNVSVVSKYRLYSLLFIHHKYINQVRSCNNVFQSPKGFPGVG
jgi:predicted nicotinamide N-methyase